MTTDNHRRDPETRPAGHTVRRWRALVAPRRWLKRVVPSRGRCAVTGLAASVVVTGLVAWVLGTSPVAVAGAAPDDEAPAGSVRLESGVRQTVMIELYTSQGCNSCPPAEEYLNTYVGAATVWKRFIPLAFHVDYWDYLGWQDRFAHPDHARRQRDYARLRRLRTVYTPAFVVNGAEWRPGPLGNEPGVDTSAVGNLTVRLDRGRVTAVFEPVDKLSGPLHLNIALVGMDLATQIEAGENAGRHSLHQFVVLAWKRVVGNGSWQTELPALNSQSTSRLALAAWVSRPDDPSPLQATGGWLPAAVVARGLRAGRL